MTARSRTGSWSAISSGADLTLLPTLTLFAAGLALCAFCRWYEARPRELGQVPLPTLPLLAVGVIMAVLAAAHLVSLLTGVPLKGRWGP